MALHLCASSSRHGNIANTCSCAQIIHTHDAQTYTHTHTVCTLMQHLIFACYSSPFDSRRDTCSFSYSTPLCPPPLFFPSLIFLCIYYSELQEALLFSADGEQFIKQRGHQKLTPQASRSLFLSPSSLKIQSGLHPRLVYPPILWLFCVFVCMCIFICVCLCACKLSRAHKDLH